MMYEMLTLLCFILLIGSLSSKELLLNGDFESYNLGWQFDCQQDPIRSNTSFKNSYLWMTPPCQVSQCCSSGGYLKMQVSSLDFNITFDQQPFSGTLDSGYYQGWVTCRHNDGCCLVISAFNTSVIIDNISLDDQVEREENRHDDMSRDIRIILIILVMVGFCICACACCHHLVKNRIDNPDSEMQEVTRKV